MTNHNLPAITNPTVNLPILTQPDEVREILEENLDGIVPEFPRIKFPSGGGLAFEIPGEEETAVETTLVGVVVDQHRMNAYWSAKYDGTKNAPDCVSLDGKVGMARPDANVAWKGGCQDCASCPLNQFGSAEDGRGKACKNMRRVAMLREGEILPILITIPPTSIKEWDAYIVGLTSKLKRPYGVVTKIKLKKATNSGGIEYSKGVFTKAGDLTPEETKHMQAYAAGLKPVLRNVTIDVTDVVEVDDGRPRDISDPGEDIA